jgi:hypothetical protein
MIGRYQMGGKPIPFLILSVPSGANVFNESVRSLMNGKISIEPGIMSFEATALLPIPKDGLYRVTAGRACTVSIAGKKYDLSNYSAKNGAAVELIKGVHRFGLSVGNNGGQLAEASVEVRDAGNGALLSPVIGRGDLESLLDEKLTEVSGWRPIPLNPKLKD